MARPARKKQRVAKSSKVSKQEGWEGDWVNQQRADELECCLCLAVSRESVAHACGQLYCESCWVELQKKAKQCSHCQAGGGAFPAFRERRDVLNLELWCTKRCGEIVRLGDLEKHLKNTKKCMERPIPCPDCSQTVTPASLPEHQTSSCVHRPIPCPDCHAATTPANLPAHHQSSCPERLVPCEQCAEKIKAARLDEHMRETCAERAQPCSLGCGVAVRRVDIANHLANAALLGSHLGAMHDELTKLSARNELFHEQNSQLEKKLEQEAKKVCELSSKLKAMDKVEAKMMAAHRHDDDPGRQQSWLDVMSHIITQSWSQFPSAWRLL